MTPTSMKTERIFSQRLFKVIKEETPHGCFHNLLTGSVRLRKRFPGNFSKILPNNPCELFLCFAIKDTIEFFLELKSSKNKEKKTTLQETQLDQIF